jgi:hypothetical protein
MKDNYKNYTPLSEKLKELEQEGYSSHFKVQDGKLVDLTHHREYAPQDVRVKDKFRFEGESNPDDMSIIYALECQNGEKGTLVNSYGLYADDEIDFFVSEIPGERSNK